MIAGVSAVTTSLNYDDAVVTRIVDGDTFEATFADLRSPEPDRPSPFDESTSGVSGDS